MPTKFIGIIVFVGLFTYTFSDPNLARTASNKTFTVTSLADTVDANPGDGGAQPGHHRRLSRCDPAEPLRVRARDRGGHRVPARCA